MMDEERCAGRFWWRRYLALVNGIIVSRGQPWPVDQLDQAAQSGRCNLTEVSMQFYISEVTLCAAIACVTYTKDNIGMTPRGILGLPDEQPAPVKAMDKFEIVSEINAARRLWGRVPSGADQLLSRVAEAVFNLPDSKVDPEELANAKAQHALDSKSMKTLRDIIEASSPGYICMKCGDTDTWSEKDETGKSGWWNYDCHECKGPLRANLPKPAKVSPFAKRVAHDIETKSSDDENPERPSQVVEIVRDLAHEFSYAQASLLDLLFDQDEDDEAIAVRNLVDLAVKCQRAAEDLGLIAKEASE